MLEAVVVFVAAPPNRGFCSAGLEAVLPNRLPPVEGAELLLALLKEKLGVPVACPNILLVAAGFDDDPNRAPVAGAVEVAALLAWPAELAEGPKLKDMMQCCLVAQECGLFSSIVKSEVLLVGSHSLLILTSLASEVH